jgi:hypothetical protein
MAAVKDDTGKPMWKIFKFGNNGWSELAAAELKIPFHADVDPDAIQIVTVDNSKGPPFLSPPPMEMTSTRCIKLHRPAGSCYRRSSLLFDLVSTSGQSVGAAVADFGGKGLSDVVANQVLKQ